jgi:hypothetical protein
MNGRSLLGFAILAGWILAVLAAPASGQETFFGKKGTVEIAGGISFSSLTPVTNGHTGDATTLFSLGPEIGYFVVDGFEIGFNPGISLLPGISVITPSEGEGTTILQLFAYPAYNLHIEGSQVTPFLQVPFGYTSMSSGNVTQSGFSWGIKGGIKVAATSHLLLTFYGQYFSMDFSSEQATERSGFNVLAFGIGVGGFF